MGSLLKRASWVIPVVLSSILLSTPLEAGGRRGVVAVSPPSPELSITFLDGVLDAGTMAWRGERRKSSIVRRAVAMRVGQPSKELRGTVTLRASVDGSGQRAVIRVNGIVLTSIPQIVERHAPVGVSFIQRVEIEVSTKEPPGPLDVDIRWEVITN